MKKQPCTKATLQIPGGLQRLNRNQAEIIKGGARREGSILGKVIIGMTGAMIFPGGWILAFL